MRLVSLAILLLVSPAEGAWKRYEVIDAGVASAFQRLGAGEAALYHSRYGFGIGTRIGEARFGAWDVRRMGLPDASAHVLSSWFPVSGYLALKSWRGGRMITPPRAESLGRVELYGTLSRWGRLWGFTAARPDLLGDLERVRVRGAVPASYLDYGIRYDHGNFVSLAVGRFEFSTDERGSFRPRASSSRWYGEIRAYLGGTCGDSVGGNMGNLLRDPWHWIKTQWRLRRLRSGAGIKLE